MPKKRLHITMTKGYGTYSPYSFTGGYYFTRLTYNFWHR